MFDTLQEADFDTNPGKHHKASMSRVEEIERAIQNLRPDELAEFRRWFAEFDNALWDAQIEADAKAGRLDALARQARAAYDRGETREL